MNDHLNYSHKVAKKKHVTFMSKPEQQCSFIDEGTEAENEDEVATPVKPAMAMATIERDGIETYRKTLKKAPPQLIICG